MGASDSGRGNTDQGGEGATLNFGRFWACRHDCVTLFIDRKISYNLAAPVAYGSARARLTPNQVSLASGVTAFVAFLLGISLPPDQVLVPILLIYGTSQLSYVFDCADGHLARVTGTMSKFGDFFDKSIDIAAFTLLFGGYFAYLCRYFMAAGDPEGAARWLFLGFFFLLARTSRFAVWQRLEAEHGAEDAERATGDGWIVVVLKNFMEMQVSLFGMLLFPFAPALAYGLFAMQTVVLAAVYARYFIRAKDLFGV